MFGINGGELVVLVLVAALVIGPERLPRYAEQLAVLVRRGRDLARDAKARVDEELGDEARDVDWAALDPRRYDPRRIVREALFDDTPAPRPTVPPRPGPTAASVAAAAPGGRWRGPAPYDDEAT